MARCSVPIPAGSGDSATDGKHPTADFRIKPLPGVPSFAKSG
jgi:hypothetical protein